MAEFVSGWLSSVGIVPGQWYTLELLAQRIGMLGDSNIHVDPRNRLFMFNNDSEMLYVKVLSGTLYEYSASDPRINQTGYVTFTLSDGSKVIGRETDDGIDVSGLGKIHTFISYDNISAFYNVGMTSKTALDLFSDLAY